LEAGSSESFVNLAACRAEDDTQRKTFGFAPSARVQELRKRILAFMETHIYPSEKELYALAFSDKKWTIHPIEEQLKKMAKSEGLWNLWIPVLISLFTSSCPCN
jgi:acyl-CoA dehydrogenase